MSPLRGLCCGIRTSMSEKGDNNPSRVTNSVDEMRHEAKPYQASKQARSGAAAEAKTTPVTGPRAAKGGGSGLSPVLIELFTSQGCSSCPPADALVSRLGQVYGENAKDLGVPVLVLAYHVDYWDYLGWKDPFASSSWTLRQRAYGHVLRQKSIYTPEAVVQGRSHCIGSNETSIKSLIQAAPRFPSPDIHATFTQPSSAELKVSLNISFKSKVEGYKLDVMVAIYENRLITDCKKGENKGRILNNDFVVTGLERACTIQDLPAKNATKGEVTLKLWEGFASSKCGIAVFLQNPVSLEVFGVQQINLPDDVK